MLLPGMQQGLTGECLTVGQALWQRLTPRLRQQQQADDAQQRAAGKDHVMQEVALLIVELHDGGSEHPKSCTSKNKAQTATPAQSEN